MRIQQLGTQLRNNPFLLNSFNLVLSAGVTAVFGFVFWTLVARSFNASDVGLATTLISVSSLLSLLGLAGFDTVFVRFLSKSKNRNEQINSGMILATVLSALIALIFCFLIPVVSPKLGFVSRNPLFSVLFIVTTVLTTLNTLTNAIFVAYRKTKFIIIINIIFSAIKMVLPFAITGGSALMIFSFVAVAQAVNVLLSVAILMRRFAYRPSLRVNTKILRETQRYGLGVYVAQVFNLLPDTVLPIIVINRLGASAAAYFYIAFTIANFLYTIAFSATQALLAEAAHDLNNLLSHVKRSTLIVTGILTIASICLIAASPLVLTLFGGEYKHGANSLLIILSISSLAVMLYSTVGTIFKLENRLKAIIITNATNSVSIISLSVIFAAIFGLNGIGWAWLLGNILAGFVGLCLLGKNRYKTYISSSGTSVRS